MELTCALDKHTKRPYFLGRPDHRCRLGAVDASSFHAPLSPLAFAPRAERISALTIGASSTSASCGVWSQRCCFASSRILAVEGMPRSTTVSSALLVLIAVVSEREMNSKSGSLFYAYCASVHPYLFTWLFLLETVHFGHSTTIALQGYVQFTIQLCVHLQPMKKRSFQLSVLTSKYHMIQVVLDKPNWSAFQWNLM